MLKTLAKDFTDVEYVITGAQSKSPNSDAASLVLCNYDDDSKLVYRLGEICVRDHYGSTCNNGYGNMYFRTNGQGTTSNVIDTRMTILHNGYIGINTTTPSCHLDVNGSLKCNSLEVVNRAPISHVAYIKTNSISTSNMFTSVSTFICNPQLMTSFPVAAHVVSYQQNSVSPYTVRFMSVTMSPMSGTMSGTVSSNVGTTMNTELGSITLSNTTPYVYIIPFTSNTGILTNQGVIEMQVKGTTNHSICIDALTYVEL
jgi:hypothetical protein